MQNTPGLKKVPTLKLSNSLQLFQILTDFKIVALLESVQNLLQTHTTLPS